jgi:dihydrofolate reductase
VKVSLIWAQSSNGVIGHDGSIPWRLPEDLKLFRSLTMGSTVLMGRATWDSLPDAFRPLPGRRNLVMTRRPDLTAPGAVAVGSVDDAFAAAQGEVWVIGGEQIYRAAMPYAHRLVVTELETAYDGDTFAPAIDASWTVTARDPADGWHTSTSGLRYRVTTHVRDLG